MIDPGLQVYVAFNLVNIGANILFCWLFWVRDRSVYSPGIVFCVIVFYLFNLHFLVEGYDHEVYARIPLPQLVEMQVWVAAVLILAQFVCLAATPRVPEVARDYDADAVFRLLLLLGGVIFVFNLAWRLAQVDWSVQHFIAELLLSRASEEWFQQGAINTGSAFDSLVRVTFLFTPFAFAIAAQSRDLAVNLTAHVLLALALVILFFGGSRTSFLAPAFAYLLFRLIRSRDRFVTGALVAPIAIAALYASSFVLNFRAVGFERIEEFSDGSITWHMDDNYPRLIFASWLAWERVPKIEGLDLILAALLGFVPRVIWPGKPELDAEYFYPYKDFNYVTVTALGELHAIMDPTLAAFVFVVASWAMIRFAYRIYRRPEFGALASLLTLYFYYYSIFRSVLNISASIYVPALMLLAYWLTMGRRQQRRQERAAAEEAPAAGAAS